MTETTDNTETMNDILSRMPWTRDQLTRAQLDAWLASRKEAGRVIDIQTCELGRWKAYDCDPYGARPDLPEEMQQVGTNRFVALAHKQRLDQRGRPSGREGPGDVWSHRARESCSTISGNDPHGGLTARDPLPSASASRTGFARCISRSGGRPWSINHLLTRSDHCSRTESDQLGARLTSSMAPECGSRSHLALGVGSPNDLLTGSRDFRVPSQTQARSRRYPRWLRTTRRSHLALGGHVAVFSTPGPSSVCGHFGRLNFFDFFLRSNARQPRGILAVVLWSGVPRMRRIERRAVDVASEPRRSAVPRFGSIMAGTAKRHEVQRLGCQCWRGPKRLSMMNMQSAWEETAAFLAAMAGRDPDNAARLLPQA